MKKLILLSLIASGAVALAKPINIFLPYAGYIDYANHNNSKKDGYVAGFYFSSGTLSYLWDFSYTRTEIKYIDKTKSKLKQNDVAATYSIYKPSYMLKAGFHYIDTTDKDLGDGWVGIFGIGGYKSVGYNKHSYGLDTYFSEYKDGFDDNGNKVTIDALQLSPYYSYSKAIDLNTRDIVTLRLNYIHISHLNRKNYLSFDLENTLLYKNFSFTTKAYVGKMKAGVRDGGHTVFNTKDEYKYGYSIKVGYRVKKNLNIAVGVGRNHYRESGANKNTFNTVAVGTLSYSF